MSESADRVMRILARTSLDVAKSAYPGLNPLIMSRGFAIDADGLIRREVDIKEGHGIVRLHFYEDGKIVLRITIKEARE